MKIKSVFQKQKLEICNFGNSCSDSPITAFYGTDYVKHGRLKLFREIMMEMMIDG